MDRLALARAAAREAAEIVLAEAVASSLQPVALLQLKQVREAMPKRMNPFLCWVDTELWVSISGKSGRIDFSIAPTFQRTASTTTKLKLFRGLSSLTVKSRMDPSVWPEWDLSEEAFFATVLGAVDAAENKGLCAICMPGHLPSHIRREVDASATPDTLWWQEALRALAGQWLRRLSPEDRALVPAFPCVLPPNRFLPLLASDPTDPFVAPYGSGMLGANELGLAIGACLLADL